MASNFPDVAARQARFARVSALAVSVDEAFIEKARSLLKVFVDDPSDVLSLGLEAAPGEYAKRFLFGDGMTSAWAFAWGPGSRTPIHDHHCPCVVGVISGSVAEEWFEPVADEGDAVRLEERHVRDQGAVTALRPARPNIHRLSNPGDAMAMTVHIYGFNHKAVTTSVDREYVLNDA